MPDTLKEDFKTYVEPKEEEKKDPVVELKEYFKPKEFKPPKWGLKAPKIFIKQAQPELAAATSKDFLDPHSSGSKLKEISKFAWD